MQLVTMTYQGSTYELGCIMPIWVELQQQFVIIPTFPFRPPFILLRMERCYLRMQDQAINYLKEGNTLPPVRRPKPMVIAPLHNIKVD